jgi:serine/threonine protein kinase
MGVHGRSSIAGVESSASGVSRRGPGRLLPARLGPYELFDHIGRGGMADIYRARKAGDFGVVREVVVKEILPELARVDRLAELLAAEAKTAARLEHTNVVRIEDLQRDASTLFIAMEYVDGLDLRELFRVCSRQGTWIPPQLGCGS